MATGGYIEKSSDQDNEEYGDEIEPLNCSHCLFEGLTKAAIKCCVECDENFCHSCLQNHNKFRSMRDHKLEDCHCVAEDKTNDDMMVSIVKMMCSKHPGKSTDMFCYEEETVCCAVCIALDHRFCQNVVYILEAEHCVEDIQSQLGVIKKAREEDLTDLQDQKKKMIDSVEESKLQLIKKIEQIAAKTKQDIESEYKDPSADIKSDITTVGTMMIKTETSRKEMEKITEEECEERLVTNMKTWIDNKTKALHILKENESNHQNKAHTLKLKKNEKLEELVTGMNALGEVVVDEKKFDYATSFHGKYNIITETDFDESQVFGSCQLENGSIILADMQNNKLKRLNTSYKVTDVVSMHSGPWGVCQVSPSELAVTLRDAKEIQFVSVTKYEMREGCSFEVGFCCRGIVSKDGKLFVACEGGVNEGPGHIQVFDFSGNYLQTFQTGLEGKQLVSFPTNMLFDKYGSKLYIANGRQGITILCIHSLKTTTINFPALNFSNGICMNDKNQIFICGRSLNNILMLNSENNGFQKIMSNKQSKVIHAPWTVLYDDVNSRLVVTCHASRDIKVFDLQRILKEK